MFAASVTELKFTNMGNKNLFKMVADPKVPKSVQDLSHEFKFSCNMGELIPVATIDCLPSDKVHLDNEALVRFMPMIAPVFDRFNVTFHRYFVAKRLLWDHWDEYVSLTKIGSPAALPVHPFVELDVVEMDPGTADPGLRLRNYMGLPYTYDLATQILNPMINPMRFSAYQFIYNEYYRDQNLIPEVPYKCVDGDNAAIWDDISILRKRAWNHDYFTSGLPFVQKGDPVLMPFSFDDVNVKRNAVPGATQWTATVGPTPVILDHEIATLNVTDEIFAETSQLQGTSTINDFRRANAIQRFQERLARVGSRFTEFLKGVFDVKSRDSRLQRPEYIGGDQKPITISEVLQTSQTTAADPSPAGTMSGHGATYIEGSNSSYFCEEHGYIIIIMNIQPKGTYFQGLEKEFLKINHPTEIYIPDLANLGEQATERQELYAYTALAKDPFNYVPRWTEHRYMPNRIAGQLAQTSLLHWTASRLFATEPNFNQTFIEMTGDGSSDRIFAVTDPEEEKLLVQLYNTVKIVRPIPKFGTPSL